MNQIKKFFIFSSESLPVNLDSLSDSLPNLRGVNSEITWNHSSSDTNTSHLNTQSRPNNNYYNIMVTIKEEFNEESGSIIYRANEGIDLDKFKNLRLDGLINGGISAILVGKAFSENCNLVSRMVVNDESTDYIISSLATGGSNAAGNIINKNFILPVGDRAFDWINEDYKLPFIKFSKENNKMNLSRSKNCSGDNQNYYGNYQYQNNSNTGITLTE